MTTINDTLFGSKFKGQIMLHPEDWESIVVTTVAVVLLLGALWKWLSNDKSTDPLSNSSESKFKHQFDDSLCNSPRCVRCHALDNDDLKEKLLTKCYDCAVKLFLIPTDEAHQFMNEHYPRVMDTISSIDLKDNILRNVYKESGYKIELAKSHPHIWMMPGLKRMPFWSVNDDGMLKHTVGATFKDPETMAAICQEYLNVSSREKGWKVNTIPAGRWQVYSLYNQGNKMKDNCSQCPRTLKALESLPNFMHCVHGNAMFSVLESGSHIEPHTGPCNYRLRCHLPLITPSGWTIQVGTESRTWMNGEILVFDDSYVHTVRHTEDQCSSLTGVNKSRVLFIFDIWHPDVKQDEQNILAGIFN